MKKHALIIILLISALPTFGQMKGWKLNAAFDPMITWVSGKDGLESDGSHMGFDFSLYANRYFHERYSYYVGLSYMNMGATVKNVGETDLHFDHFNLTKGKSASYRAQYLCIPFGLKLHTTEFGLFSYYFSAGLYTGVRVGGSIKARQGNDNDEKYSISGDANAVTAGTQLGAGILYALGDNNFLQGGLKFNYGFVDMLKGDAINAQPIGIGLHLGFVF